MDREAWGGYSPWGHKELDTTEQLALLLVIQYVQCPYKGDIWTQRCTQKEDDVKRQGEDSQSQGESLEQIFPSQSSEGNNLLTPGFWAWSLQNCQKINFCCFKPLSPWEVAIATVVEQYIHSLVGVLGRGYHLSEAVSSSTIRGKDPFPTDDCKYLAQVRQLGALNLKDGTHLLPGGPRRLQFGA